MRISDTCHRLESAASALRALSDALASLQFCEDVLVKFDAGRTEGALISHEAALRQHREAALRVLVAAHTIP